MEYRLLGNSRIRVSALCLGTMTWGEQNTEAQAHEQLDYALDQGINFLDTAEMYPVPARAQTQGATETIIGNWLKQRNRRDRIILATKVAGPGRDWLTHFRGGNNRLDRANIESAVDESLRRLQTDYIDYYQLHWPDRQTNYFGKRGYPWPEQDDSIPLEETLAVLADLVRAGKVREIGVSNETPWGVMRGLCLSENRRLPRIQGIQNPYSLLNRSFEVGLAEISHREQVGLLAYSPLGFGVLSGKYLDGAHPAGARLTLFPDYNRYSNVQARAATKAYVKLARDYDLDPTQMALAFVTSRPFVTSNIIGATSLKQLRSNIASQEIRLPGELLAAIDRIYQRYTDPAP
ncbi:NADP(H)-dependent aldo-keto reductase [Thiolapillus brandeum]|uniref:Protein tas n=1 Tax=Thiolapillus brandeum TaxID=1076588 RepID=A0A7U6GL56_9GAMM|nr:NADP(H)-dependent aldo-keto reductase [Thiolapillus brandeum]BAO45661.1 aldo/keto reductase family oxidoreductase [Thiolapillus brandeum]